jgi:TAG lipase/steryl ester hydrolase/phospholipase A2/LPA acyltransferase
MTDLTLHVFGSNTVGTGLKNVQKKPQWHSARTRNHADGLALTRIIRDTNNLILSLRDGLSASEREHQRHVEERKTILGSRMQNVRSVVDSP